jgi:hypothetical protein
MSFPKLCRNTNNQAMRRASTLRKIGSENPTLWDDRAHKIALRVQDTRTTCFETKFKTLIKMLGNRVTQRLDKRNTPKSEDHVWFEDRWMVASLCDE